MSKRNSCSPIPIADAVEAIKFLVVDDARSSLDAMAALLQRDGLEIHCAQSGREALELLLVHEYALALVDVHMPDIGGLELAEIMRSTESTRTIPIVFITGDASDPVHEFRGYDAGAVDFLMKPVAPHALRNKADTFFELAQQRQALQRLAVELEETLELNETFVAAVTHDLRTPLSTVIMGVEMLAESVSDPTERKAVGMLRSSTARMRSMIDALTDLARARLSGGIPIEPDELDAYTLARSIVDEVAAAHPERALELELEGDPAACWDRAQVGRLLANLVGNAVRHGDAQHPVRVGIDGSAPQRVVLRVANRGTISAQSLPRLFDPFWREKKAGGDGLGLGLYIAHQIALAHGGSIEVDSHEARGTTFGVTLPRRR